MTRARLEFGLRRTIDLTTLRRSFTRRWVTGITIGFLLALGNSVGYQVSHARLRSQVADVDGAHGELDRLVVMNLGLTALAFVVLLALAVFFFRPLGRALRSEVEWRAETETRQREEADRQGFDAELHEALDMAQDEAGTLAVIERVLASVVPEHPAELLLADSSEAHLAVRAVNPSAGAAGCGVQSPFDCPAVRRARAVEFPSSTSINACPHLVGRDGGDRSAHCVPVAFMGRALGVLHLTGDDGRGLPVADAEKMAALAGQVGTHIGTVRAFVRAELQASTDSLTGLSNRRAFEDAVSRRLAHGESFAIVMADLDHFKKLNDAHGHQAGDQALRLFAEAVRQSLRADDLIARWGGEEFVIAMPGVTAEQAADALHRVRLSIVDACARAEVPAISASFGVVDSRESNRLDEMMRRADAALLEAKRAGRDRVLVGT